MWHVYILKCNDASLYTGVAIDIKKRLQRHNRGVASKYTRSRRPVELLYAEKFDNKSEALRREIEIKSFSAKNKQRLLKFGLGQRFPSPHSDAYSGSGLAPRF